MICEVSLFFHCTQFCILKNNNNNKLIEFNRQKIQRGKRKIKIYLKVFCYCSKGEAKQPGQWITEVSYGENIGEFYCRTEY